MSGHVDRTKYDVFLRMVREGKYSVDTEAGTLTGPTGCVLGRPGRERPGYGYGQAFIYDNTMGRFSVMVHRAVWEVAKGPVPDGMEINHINGKKSDNRLENLEVVTPGDNQRHAHLTGLKRAQRGAENPLATLKLSVVESIRQMYASGMRQCEVAERSGVSRPQVSRIVRGLTW